MNIKTAYKIIQDLGKLVSKNEGSEPKAYTILGLGFVKHCSSDLKGEHDDVIKASEIVREDIANYMASL
jgi:hypothetical protein